MKKEERPKQNYINFGSSVRPVGSLRQIQPFLDAKVYNIDVPPMSGPVLDIVDNIDLSVPERVYGDIMARVDKSFEAYSYRERNTGILLSGERGMGKTLFIRIAINRALGMGIPVIMLRKTDALSAIIETINSITQPVLVVMDEFEKNFKIESENADGTDGSQMEFLTMLDGLGSCEKRMFIASVNDTDKLNEFLLNRPGRFYYHFEFPALSDKECTEYLIHETKGVSKKDIKYAVIAMQNYNINYDCLAAIASELSHKRSIDDTLRDLNLDRHGNNEYAVFITINGNEYSGVLAYSLNQLQDRRENRTTMYLYSTNPLPPKIEKVSTGYLGSMVHIVVSKFPIEMTKDGEIQFPIDATNFVELYCPDGGVKIPGKKDDDGDNYYLTLEEVKSISKATLKPMKRERSALYLRKDF